MARRRGRRVRRRGGQPGPPRRGLQEVQRPPARGRRTPSLRLWGFRLDLEPSDEGPQERFPCAHLCRKSGTRLLDPDARAAMSCALPGWDTRRNTGERLVRLRVHMGAPPRYEGEGRDHDWDRPLEPADNGCPGSWHRSPFVESVLKYRRRPDGNGGRVPNRLLDLCNDEVVIEAVEALEAFEDAWRGEYQAAQFAKHKREAAAYG